MSDKDQRAEPWQPPPGMVKLRCRRCGHDFAAVPRAGRPSICPNCTPRNTRPKPPRASTKQGA